ncbi:MAG: hypothetical protein KC550_05110, partial [Nanoarchaeota archaeon]|nr:hypothetical protein [Nanoarchaeota archaeon]
MLDGLIKIFFKKKGSELEIINEVLVYILAINSWDELESVLNKKKEILEFDFLKKDKNLKSLL